MTTCECGCGGAARRGKRFIHGHAGNSRRRSGITRRFVDNEGYVRVFVGREHPMALSTGYVMEHRLVMAESLGRLLDRHEVVHHKNAIRDDNRLENLELFESPTAHNRHHAKLRADGLR